MFKSPRFPGGLFFGPIHPQLSFFSGIQRGCNNIKEDIKGDHCLVALPLVVVIGGDGDHC